MNISTFQKKKKKNPWKINQSLNLKFHGKFFMVWINESIVIIYMLIRRLLMWMIDYSYIIWGRS